MKNVTSQALISPITISLLFLSCSAIAAQSSVLELDTSSGAQGDCSFQTESGVRVMGDNPDVMLASGDFIGGCSQAGGATSAFAHVAVNPAVIDAGDSATIYWRGDGDVCRDGGSSFAGNVSGWPLGADFCLGGECSMPHSMSQSFPVDGVYTFKLRCLLGADQQSPGEIAVATATLQVEDTSQPPGQCDMSTGLIRQMVGTIASPSGADEQHNVPLAFWEEIYGWDFHSGSDYWEWPGLLSNAVKFFIMEQHYVSLEFTVRGDFPLFDPATQTGPYGFFDPSGSSATSGDWTISISETCGDFDRPALGDRLYGCYQPTLVATGGLPWAVIDPSVDPAGMCPLERGHTYYLNIVMAPISNPDAAHANTSCIGDICKYNLKNGGNFSGTYGPQ